jgi:hypothetical protein
MNERRDIVIVVGAFSYMSGELQSQCKSNVHREPSRSQLREILIFKLLPVMGDELYHMKYLVCHWGLLKIDEGVIGVWQVIGLK